EPSASTNSATWARFAWCCIAKERNYSAPFIHVNTFLQCIEPARPAGERNASASFATRPGVRMAANNIDMPKSAWSY
ncbi:hypothetical protein, partial [Burkholderia ubonensis]|uniref:hypothetical protein n=1 Tax=Burkholderia ubonensis TaxID=101571 RepID=UPI001C42FDA6